MDARNGLGIFFQSCDVTHWQSCTRGINQIGQDQQMVVHKSPLNVFLRQAECIYWTTNQTLNQACKIKHLHKCEITWITWFFEGNFGQPYHARNDLYICPLMKEARTQGKLKTSVLQFFDFKKKKKRTK